MEVELGVVGRGPGDRQGTVPAPIWYQPHRPTWMRVLNGLGGIVRRSGARWPRIEVGELLAAAERRTGLSDFGDHRFREGLEVLVEAFESQDSAHTFGRLYFREYCTRLLVNRLKIQDDLKRHPEILEVRLPRPLFITGLPRSGTTHLHRLISEDPACRSLHLWETLEPSPPPVAERRGTDPRIARARKTVRTLCSLAPAITVAHEFDAESPEECNALFAHGFLAGMIGFMFDVPRYVEWMSVQELVGPYRYLRSQLQLLSWRCPGDPWVLKAPAHLYGLDAILTVFPDACIVQTHRDPLQVIPSLCSLSAAFRGIVSDRVDLRRLGSEYTQAMAEGPERAIDVRARSDSARFLDVAYPELVADPLSVIRAIYTYFGYTYTPEFESRMKRRLAENPQHQHGVHRYSLEQFGLEAVTVRAQFARYIEWMTVHTPKVS